MKPLALTVVAALLTGLLAGCGGNTGPDAQREIGDAAVKTYGAVTRSHADTNLYDVVSDGAPLLAVVQEFCKLPDATILVAPGELDGTATVRLNEVHWRPALSSILDLHGFYMVEKIPGSGVLSIVKRLPGMPDPLITEVFLFSTPTEAVEAAEAIRQIWGAEESVKAAAIPSSSALILRAYGRQHAEIRHILKCLPEGMTNNAVDRDAIPSP